MENEIKRKLDDHRSKAFICCEESCFCWEVEAMIAEIEEKESDSQC